MLSASIGSRTTRWARPSKSIRSGSAAFAAGFFSSFPFFAGAASASPFASSSFTSSLSGANGLATSRRRARAKTPTIRLPAKFHSTAEICGVNSRSERK